ncbi:MAG TPA: hypothetical protein V6D28_27315 [Leptolyngbyaceae cyanobacterium]
MIVKSQSITWNDLPNINEVDPFNENDEECLNEIRTVLEKYNLTSRFGVALLHKHFQVLNDEVLVESCDAKHRTLSTRTVKALEAENMNLITTMWRFDGGIAYKCSYCKKDHHT